MKSHDITYESFYELTLTYIDIYKPSVKDTMHFVGALIYSVIDRIDMTEYEKEFYEDIYNKLISKKLKEKESIAFTIG